MLASFNVHNVHNVHNVYNVYNVFFHYQLSTLNYPLTLHEKRYKRFRTLGTLIENYFLCVLCDFARKIIIVNYQFSTLNFQNFINTCSVTWRQAFLVHFPSSVQVLCRKFYNLPAFCNIQIINNLHKFFMSFV